MGKKSKSRRSGGDAVEAPLALEAQLESLDSVSAVGRRSKSGRRKRGPQEPTDFLPPKDTAAILATAHKQVAHDSDDEEEEAAKLKRRKPRTISLVMDEEEKKKKRSGKGSESSSEEEEEPIESDADWEEPPQLDPDEAAALERFNASEPAARRTLADIIAEKIAAKEGQAMLELKSAGASFGAGGESALVADIPPPVVEMYQGVRDVLKTYRSGRLPKAFKLIPKLSNWEQIVQLTEPESWSAAAMYQGTRIFVSNLSGRLCQRFLNLVLLPRVRDDIAEYGKLNFHLYQALKKALFKPAAFFKGMLIPLCEEGTCTLREATIIGSVLAKSSIPMLHAAAAMLLIAEMEYAGANSLFLRLLIDKAYTLPYRVLDALTAHFVRFALDPREMTVLWHQSLLAFVQRYKSDLAEEQRDQVLDLVKIHFHHQIGPEIRRELAHVTPRDVEDGSTMPNDMDME